MECTKFWCFVCDKRSSNSAYSKSTV